MAAGVMKLGRAGIVAATLILAWACDVRGAEGPPSVPAEITPETLTDAEVVAAIERGLNFLIDDLDRKIMILKKVPEAELHDPNKVPDAGELMLEAYSLLHVGADVKDPRLQVQSERMKVVESVLLRLNSDQTYVTALQTLALAEMPQTAEVKRMIAKTAAKLVDGRGKVGGYTYALDKTSETHDQSNSQYGLLAVWAAADFGVAIPGRYWSSTDKFWRALQLSDGGWGYGGGAEKDQLTQKSTPSMTAAGVASLFVCDEFLNRAPRLTPREDSAIDNGMSALVGKFDPNSDDSYYLYGVERVGLASGRKFFGKVDWYRSIAVNLLKRERKDNGSFPGRFVGEDLARSTCYSILLLARGRAPVLMNKLQYDGPWNLRPRDSANLHAHVARILERHMNWQSVPLDVSPEQWLDAPILLIAGSKDPNFTPEDVAKLRRYVRAGGIIFSIPDGKSEEFSAAVKKYALEVAGEPGAPAAESAFRELPADHPLFSVTGTLAKPPKLMGVSNGLRELWIHGTEDYGAIWQSREMSPPEPWELPVMLFSYAAGKEELRSKLQTLAIPAPAKRPALKTTVALVSHGGNWNPEPDAWPRLAQLMALDGSADVTVTEVRARDLGKMSPPPAIAHLAGTGKLTLSEQEQESLKAYVVGGGTLFVEALGGNAPFATSAKEMLKGLFPSSSMKLVPPSYTLFTGTFSPTAASIASVKYRRYWTLEHGQQSAPGIEYMTVNHRVGVFFSGEDVTSGLLGTNTWGIGGYMPDSAIAIARNLVLYAARNAKARPKGPATRASQSRPTGK